jgi:hypothetical protein
LWRVARRLQQARLLAEIALYPKEFLHVS